MYKFRIADPRHLELINAKDCYSDSEMDVARMLLNVSQKSKDCAAVTLINNDKAVGICGIARQWEGVGQLWSVLDKDVQKTPIALTKTCLYLIDFYVNYFNLHRLSFTVRKDYHAGYRFAETLGFTSEGVMRKHFPDGEDAVSYGRIF